MSLTTQQPKGQCVWGARAIILVTGKHFAEKWAHRIVLPNCWDFFAELGGWLHWPGTFLSLCRRIRWDPCGSSWGLV